MTDHRAKIWVAAVVVALFASCGGGEVGDTCETPASDDECVDEAVCEELSDGEVVCLLECEDQADCGSNDNCNGLSDGSNRKACHPKKQ